MLALISFDAVSRPLLDRMVTQGRLPNCAELLRTGANYVMDTTPIHASVYRSLYTGFGPSTHGLHYPVQWCASEQRVKPADPFNPEVSIFARLGRAGRRMLVIDPPECGRFSPKSGTAISGWQFTSRFMLPQWDSSKHISRMLKRRFGAPRGCHEVFGTPSISRLRAMREVLQSAPHRLADATIACLKQSEFDFVWITFVAAHIAGHQLWRASLDSPEESPGRDPELIAGIYQKLDEALGRILSALPPQAEVIVCSPNGMGPETSRVEFLPPMLARIIDKATKERAVNTSGNALWRLRALMPTSLRAVVADALPDRLALRLATYLECTGKNWKNTRAFALPSDGAGFVRLNMKGRERDGILDPRDADDVLEEIVAGLKTFVEPSGENMVASVIRSSDLDGLGPKLHLLPDLIVLWSQKSKAGLRMVTSPQFGEVRSEGVGSGRSGNHCGGTWATVVAGAARKFARNVGPVKPVDLSATVCALMDVPHDDLPGRPLVE